MSLPGSGTYEDPYVISNWEEYITAQTSGDASKWYAFPIDSLQHPTEAQLIEGRLYVDSTGEVIRNPKTAELSTYYVNPFTLDFNDYAEEGLTAPITTRIKLNGRGGQFINPTQASGYSSVALFSVSGTCEWKNIAVNNIWSKSNYVFYRTYNDDKIILERCAFMGKLENLSNFIYNYQASATSCSFNFDLENCSGWQSSFAGDNKFYYCRFNLNGSISQVRMPSYNSYFTGEITGQFLFYYGSQYSVCDMVAGSINASGGDEYTHCLYNNEKTTAASSASSLPASYLTGVTTADLRDADALYATGFPIER